MFYLEVSFLFCLCVIMVILDVSGCHWAELGLLDNWALITL